MCFQAQRQTDLSEAAVQLRISSGSQYDELVMVGGVICVNFAPALVQPQTNTITALTGTNLCATSQQAKYVFCAALFTLKRHGLVTFDSYSCRGAELRRGGHTGRIKLSFRFLFFS